MFQCYVAFIGDVFKDSFFQSKDMFLEGFKGLKSLFSFNRLVALGFFVDNVTELFCLSLYQHDVLMPQRIALVVFYLTYLFVWRVAFNVKLENKC